MGQTEKGLVVKELKDKFQAAKTILLTDYRGLNAGELQELRSKLRRGDVEYKVIKNNLAKITLEELGLGNLTQYLEGPIAIAFGFKELVDPAKILVNFAKEHNIKVFANPGNSQLNLGMKALRPILNKIDILLLNQEEASLLTKVSYQKEKQVFKKFCTDFSNTFWINHRFSGKHFTIIIYSTKIIFSFPFFNRIFNNYIFNKFVNRPS